MIRGSVTPFGRAVVRIAALGSEGQTDFVGAILDTGFSGDVALPLDIIERLGWRLVGGLQSWLADDSSVLMDMYEGQIEWDGQLRGISCYATKRTALVGMSLLHATRLTVDIIDGGEVTISPLEQET